MFLASNFAKNGTNNRSSFQESMASKRQSMFLNLP